MKQPSKYHVWYGLLLSAAGLLIFQTVLEACPACKEALFDPSQLHQKLSAAKGYALSILLLLCVPLGLIGGIVTLLVRASRKRRRMVSPSSPRA